MRARVITNVTIMDKLGQHFAGHLHICSTGPVWFTFCLRRDGEFIGDKFDRHSREGGNPVTVTQIY